MFARPLVRIRVLEATSQDTQRCDTVVFEVHLHAHEPPVHIVVGEASDDKQSTACQLTAHAELCRASLTTFLMSRCVLEADLLPSRISLARPSMSCDSLYPDLLHMLIFVGEFFDGQWGSYADVLSMQNFVGEVVNEKWLVEDGQVKVVQTAKEGKLLRTDSQKAMDRTDSQESMESLEASSSTNSLTTLKE